MHQEQRDIIEMEDQGHLQHNDHLIENHEGRDETTHAPKPHVPMTNIEEEERNRGTELILYQTPQEVPEYTNFFFLMYIFIQIAGDLICQCVISYVIISAYKKPEFTLAQVPLYLARYHIWKILFNSFYLIFYGKRLPELRMSYMFDMILSTGLLVVYYSFHEYLTGGVDISNLQYLTLFHVMITFIRLVGGSMSKAAYLPAPQFGFLESIQFFAIAVKLGWDTNQSDWSWGLVFYNACSGVALVLALLVLLIAVCLLFLVFNQNENDENRLTAPSMIAFMIVAFYIIWSCVAYYMVVSGFKTLLETGKISPVVSQGPVDTRLLIAAWLILISAIISLIFMIVIYCLLKVALLEHFKGNKPKEISLQSFAKSLQMNVKQVSGNYFKTGELDEESPKPKETLEQCLICMDKKTEVLIDPCGHGCLCEECAKEYLKKEDKCPLCREEIEKIYLIFEDPENNGFMARGVIKLKR
jgi:hypothetical protein